MDVAAWLQELGLERYERAFRDNEIDADLLPNLTADDLKDLGVSLVGHRRRLLDAIAALRTPQHEDVEQPGDEAPAVPPEARPEAERRQLTVMFVDLVGSTELSRRLDPEDMRTVIGEYHKAVAREVARFEGYIAKFMGDGVLAYFGWPQAHEDDAERAVGAGLAITRAVARLEGGGARLECRVGVATGLVVVGDLVGQGAAQEQAVVGETPNLAARLQAAAPASGVVISATTRRLLGELFELEPLEDLELKGFEAGATAFRVLAEGRSESRFAALHSGRLPPLVGRDHELGLLLDRWSHAKDGEGQVVLLSGEPGIGKSRLIEGLRERLRDEQHMPLPHYGSAPSQQQCVPPDRSTSRARRRLRPG